jgi:hypothetical protein
LHQNQREKLGEPADEAEALLVGDAGEGLAAASRLDWVDAAAAAAAAAGAGAFFETAGIIVQSDSL